jgi:UDP-N-acetylglucosamine kinase
MNDEENKLSQIAIEFIEKNKRRIVDQFISDSGCQSSDHPVTLFMAGSPGAGKTEVSKRLIEKFEDKKPIRIDADDIRVMLPGYVGNNSHIFQRACSIGVNLLYGHAIKNKLNIILDGTFASKEVVFKDVQDSVSNNRKIEIYYIFQEPLTA